MLNFFSILSPFFQMKGTIKGFSAQKLASPLQLFSINRMLCCAFQLNSNQNENIIFK